MTTRNLRLVKDLRLVPWAGVGEKPLERLLAFGRVQESWTQTRRAFAELQMVDLPGRKLDGLDLLWILKLEILRHAVYGQIIEAARQEEGMQSAACSAAHLEMAAMVAALGWVLPWTWKDLLSKAPGRWALSLLPGRGRPRERAMPKGEGVPVTFFALDPPGRGLNSRPVAAWARAWAERGQRPDMVLGYKPHPCLLEGPWGVTPLRLPQGLAPRNLPAAWEVGGWEMSALLRRAAARLACRYQPLLRRHAAFWRGYLERQSPRALVVVNDCIPMARLAILCAQELGIPTFSAHAALLLPSPMYADLAAHYLCVQDLEMQEYLARTAKVEAMRMRCTGPLEPAPERGEGPEAGRAPQHVLLCTENAAQREFMDVLARLQSWVGSGEGRQLRVRVHPEEDAKSYAASGVEMSQVESAEEDLSWAEVVVTGASTMGMRAVVRGKALLSMVYGPLSHSPHGRDGEAIRLSSPEQLSTALDSLTDENVRQALRDGRRVWRQSRGWPEDSSKAACDFLLEVCTQGGALPALLP